jgi:hypothetical protein
MSDRSNREEAVVKTIFLRSLQRIQHARGIIVKLPETKTGTLYDTKLGKCFKATLKNGNWVIGTKSATRSVTTNYDYCTVYGTCGVLGRYNMQIGTHRLGAIAMGMFDSIDDDILEHFVVNHPFYNTNENRPEWIEVCLDTDNQNHAKLKKQLIKAGIYEEGMGWWAKDATWLYQNFSDSLERFIEEAMKLNLMEQHKAA